MGTCKNVLNKSQRIALIGLFSGLFIVARALRIHLKVQGLGGLSWFIILMVASLLIPERFTSTRVSTIGGIISAFFFDTPLGIFKMIKYLSAGIMLDILNDSLFKKRLNYYVAAFIGSITYTTSSVLPNLYMMEYSWSFSCSFQCNSV